MIFFLCAEKCYRYRYLFFLPSSLFILFRHIGCITIIDKNEGTRILQVLARYQSQRMAIRGSKGQFLNLAGSVKRKHVCCQFYLSCYIAMAAAVSSQFDAHPRSFTAPCRYSWAPPWTPDPHLVVDKDPYLNSSPWGVRELVGRARRETVMAFTSSSSPGTDI